MRPVVKAKKTTREVVAVFDSVSAAAREGGKCPDVLNRTLARNGLGTGEFYYRYVDVFDPDESFGHVRKNRPVLAVNRLTGRWMWFEGVSAAARHFGMKPSAVSRSLKSGSLRKGYAFVYADRRMRAERCEVKA